MTDAKQEKPNKGWAALNTCGAACSDPRHGTGASPEGRGWVSLRIRSAQRSAVRAAGQGRAQRALLLLRSLRQNSASLELRSPPLPALLPHAERNVLEG